MGKGIFIVGAKRTPFGAFGGKLKGFSATDLATHASEAALGASGVSADKVDAVFMGNVIQSATDAAYLARHVGLRAGAPIATPALTVNRLCGSGFEAVLLGAESILLGHSSVALCGGTENMSNAPMTVDGNAVRWGTALGRPPAMNDSLWSGLTDSLSNTPMGVTAENLAERFSISREDCDAYAVRSQHAFAAAHSAGVFSAEMAPMEVTLKKKGAPVTVDADEHPRGLEADMAAMARLPPVFKKGGAVTAASASGICDGAASLVVASEEACGSLGLSPLARIAGYHRVGCEPEIMGYGPVDAIRGALGGAGISLQDVDLVEINEAFAAQYLACEKELGLDRERTNVNGGAIAIGHPLGASGARITAHLAHRLQATGKRYAVGAACIGGGQGIAIVLENAAL